MDIQKLLPADTEPQLRHATRNTFPSTLVLIAFFLAFIVTAVFAPVVKLVKFVVRLPCYLADVVICFGHRRKAPITPHHGYAVVTGASSGIGEQIAIELAQLGYDLVLIALEEDHLLSLKMQFEEGYFIRVVVLPLDLSTPNAAAEVHTKCREIFPSRSCAILVNNAGFCAFGDFAEQSTDTMSRLIHVNVLATVELTRVFLPEMLENDRGRILIISSIMARFWVPYTSVYCGSKAFLSHWAMSLVGELVDTGVSVTCVEPGGTKTKFFESQGASDVLYTKLHISMDAHKVALNALNAMWKAKATQIVGILNWWNVAVVEALSTSCQMLVNQLVLIDCS